MSGGKHIDNVANFDAEVWVNLDYYAVNQRRPAVSAKPDDEVSGRSLNGMGYSSWNSPDIAAEISDAPFVPAGGYKVSLPSFVVLPIVWKSISG